VQWYFWTLQAEHYSLIGLQQTIDYQSEYTSLSTSASFYPQLRMNAREWRGSANHDAQTHTLFILAWARSRPRTFYFVYSLDNVKEARSSVNRIISSIHYPIAANIAQLRAKREQIFSRPWQPPFSTEIYSYICPLTFSVPRSEQFPESVSRKNTMSTEEQIISKDKYPSIFSR